MSRDSPGPDTNGCQFFITCKAADWLDGKHTVFGRVLDEASMKVVRAVEAVTVEPSSSAPRMAVTVEECGEL